MADKNVFVGNYDLALIAACDKAGHGRIAWVDVKKGEARIGKKIFELDNGQNSESQANMLALLAGAMRAKTKGEEDRKVLLVMTDKVAPRFFEVLSASQTMNSKEEVLAKVTKGWMNSLWQESLEEFVSAYADVIGAGHLVGGVKASELTFARLEGIESAGTDPYSDEEGVEVTEGTKLLIEKGVVKGAVTENGVVPVGDEAHVIGDRFATGKFTVVNRGTEEDPVLAIDRWENTPEDKIPASYADLLDTNRALWDSLPKRERLKVCVEA
jgi:hypothetical protein